MMQSESDVLAIAQQLHSEGRLTEALRVYQQILQQAPNHRPALFAYGVVASQLGLHEQAIHVLKQANRIEADNPLIAYNLAWAYERAGALEPAVEWYRHSIQLNEVWVDAHVGLGLVLRQLGHFGESSVALQRAIQLRPNDPELYNMLGMVLSELERLDDAGLCFQRAIQLRIDYADAHFNLGNIYRLQGNLEAAVTAYELASRLNPESANIHHNLGNVLVMQGRYESAVASFRRALQRRPNCAGLAITLAHQQQHVCDWSDLEALTRSAVQIAEQQNFWDEDILVTPFMFLSLPIVTTAAQQLRCSQQWSKRVSDSSSKAFGNKPLRAASRSPSKIRIGYLSSDYHAHATAWLIVEMFEAHDREHFEVFGYSFGKDDGSAIRQRVVESFDHFRDITADTHEQAALRIASDQIDILIDLKGYTTNSRPEIMALRPAPIQISYLGFPGTMGASFIDYILVDAFVVPADQQAYFTERLVHLPGCYQVNDRQREISTVVPSRGECALPEDGFVFCSFNASYKLTPMMFEVWMRLLKAIPGSVLWQLESNTAVSSNLKREAESRGVAAERLIFAPKLPHASHLARLGLADLFLDSFPVNAHTTASDALRMGLPMVTLAGTTFVSRVAGSLLHTLELDEGIATSLEAYESLALRFAQQPAMLAAYRRKLAAQLERTTLFDGQVFARNIERAYCELMQPSHRWLDRT